MLIILNLQKKPHNEKQQEKKNPQNLQNKG